METHREQRWIWCGVITTLAALISLMAGWWCQVSGPPGDESIRGFLAAAREHDAAGMLRWVEPGETKHLGITPENLSSILAEAASSSGGLVTGELEWIPLDWEQARSHRWAEVTVFAADGAAMWDGHGRPVRVIVPAYRARAAWKIGLSQFLISLLVARYGLDHAGHCYREICARHGIRPVVFSPTYGGWVNMSPRRSKKRREPSRRENLHCR